MSMNMSMSMDIRYQWPIEQLEATMETGAIKQCSACLKNGKMRVRFPDGTSRAVMDRETPLLLQKLANKVNNKKLRIIVESLNNNCFGGRAPVRFARFSHRLTRSMGNYSSRDVLKISTRIMFKPIAVFDYVVIHELAHGFEFNHSKQFWQIVEAACPEYRQIKDWINREQVKGSQYEIVRPDIITLQ